MRWYNSTVALRRALSLVIVILVCFGAEVLREATSPSGSGYWPAVAAAPGGGLYVADETTARLRVVSEGHPDRELGTLPKALYRGLAAEGSRLILATQTGLYVSFDGGERWVLKNPRRFTAVALSGNVALAGAWNDSLWQSRDGGDTWSSVRVPAGDTEFESLAIGPGYEIAATLLGILVSRDGGDSWVRARGIGNRVTAVDGLAAGDWYGNLYGSSDGGLQWATTGHVPGGVWSLAGPLAGTTGGVYRAGRRTGGLGGREITRVISSPPHYYAAVARGPVYVSDLGGGWHPSAQG